MTAMMRLLVLGDARIHLGVMVAQVFHRQRWVFESHTTLVLSQVPFYQVTA